VKEGEEGEGDARKEVEGCVGVMGGYLGERQSRDEGGEDRQRCEAVVGPLWLMVGAMCSTTDKWKEENADREGDVLRISFSVFENPGDDRDHKIGASAVCTAPLIQANSSNTTTPNERGACMSNKRCVARGSFENMPREIITLQLGQCGNQSNNSFNPLLLSYCPLLPSPLLLSYCPSSHLFLSWFRILETIMC
jgi:hypothetical protein